MNLKSFWERHRAQRWAGTAGPVPKPATPTPFQPLTRQESIEILADSIEWLRDEASIMLGMPEGALKELRRAELRGRNNSITQDFQRLLKQQG